MSKEVKNNITKEEWELALRERRIFVTSAKETRNGITGYNVYWYYQKNMNRVVVRSSRYWSESKHYYHSTAWGINRSFAIIESISSHLGLKDLQLMGNYQFI